TARIAILHGAQFIVSPVFNKKIAFLCNKYSIPYIPGCMTLTECVIALKYGAEIVKLFPGNLFEPNIIKAFQGPVPNVNIMPTGGINIRNLKDWLDGGAVMIGVGGEITKFKSTYEEITDKCKLFLN